MIMFAQRQPLQAVTVQTATAGERDVGSAGRQGDAVHTERAVRAQLPQLHQGVAHGWQQDFCLWHQCLLAAVHLEGGEALPQVI